ncbi:hypothetical protein SARC_10218 [Sphaeroforma arctica JP610]|uniref:PrpF protein n=1 Tax=Sphaeroforma arctica JP610 TaxID=667725 RepID=A0A0L0FKL2_9EUKA|nr:hypothetical protein SARC_10218 [Sphaeroforma arctica JP610]KNC77317.1 hypothetical protein SARC_10218 [Sphaeroforma arctica JP610]|eukprot:XP_014151219.1 hypothetical protein SARC_10218 [Sphaeroforma arctica JP610]
MHGRVRAAFMRGGTSKGLFFREKDLPKDAALRDSIICQAMGSPDVYGRQLNGMGGGLSSLSKVMILSTPPKASRRSRKVAHVAKCAEVHYSFGQVDVASKTIEWNGNCGNLTTCIGPLAVDWQLVPRQTTWNKATRVMEKHGSAGPLDFPGNRAARIHSSSTCRQGWHVLNHGQPVPIDLLLKNTNTGKFITSRFHVAQHRDGMYYSTPHPAQDERDGSTQDCSNTTPNGPAGADSGTPSGQERTDETVTIPGVDQRHLPVELEFAEPAGAVTGRLLPTGNACDTLQIEGMGSVVCSIVDATTPCVFVRASDLGLTATELPNALEARIRELELLERVRIAARDTMGIASASSSVPKVAIVGTSAAADSLAKGQGMSHDEMDIHVRMLSMGKPHKAIPLTGGMCAAVAAVVPGSIIAEFIHDDSVSAKTAPELKGDAATSPEKKQTVRIGTPSGVVEFTVRSSIMDKPSPKVASNRTTEETRGKQSLWKGAKVDAEGVQLDSTAQELSEDEKYQRDGIKYGLIVHSVGVIRTQRMLMDGRLYF